MYPQHADKESTARAPNARKAEALGKAPRATQALLEGFRVALFLHLTKIVFWWLSDILHNKERPLRLVIKCKVMLQMLVLALWVAAATVVTVRGLRRVERQGGTMISGS